MIPQFSADLFPEKFMQCSFNKMGTFPFIFKRYSVLKRICILLKQEILNKSITENFEKKQFFYHQERNGVLEHQCGRLSC